MSSFHTKTISKILEPVAQQVSKLILNIEDDECPNQFVDLDVRVNMVKSAVENLVKVGRETICQSDDKIFSEEMPVCLANVNEASEQLLKAVKCLQADFLSSPGRKSLISGSRGILKGTFEVLNCFDMSEVRKIVGYCESVQLVLATAENVETMPDLKEVIRNLTPCMSQMISNVTTRLDELIIPYHVEILSRSVEEIKQLTPILISALKLYISSKDNNSQRNYEIRANRDFLITQMTEDIQEIIRALRLTSLDNEEAITFKTAKTILDSSIKTARDSLKNPSQNSGFEPTFRQTLFAMKKISQFTLDNKLRGQLDERIREFEDITSRITNLKYQNLSDANMQKNLSNYSRSALGILEELDELCQESIGFHDSSSANVYKTARTFEGKFNQAQKWILNPTGPYRNVGFEACRVLTNDSKRLMCRADGINNNRHCQENEDCEWIDACFESCEHLDRAAVRLDELLKQKQSPEVIKKQTDLSLAMSKSLISVWKRLQEGLVYEVADWFTDLLGPLRQFSDVAFTSYQDGESDSLEEEFYEKSEMLSTHSERVCNIAEVAASNLNDYLKADSLRTLCFYLPELTNQVLLSGKILFKMGTNLANNQMNEKKGQFSIAEQHFNLMKNHWTQNIERMQALVDEAMDAYAFIKAQENKIGTDSSRTEIHLRNQNQLGIVESTTSIARRANRILQIGKKEADNSEDLEYTNRVKSSLTVLHSSIKPMMMHVKQLIINPSDRGIEDQWRRSNLDLIKAVSTVKGSITPTSYSANNEFNQSLSRDAILSNRASQMALPVQEMKQVMLNDEDSQVSYDLRHFPSYNPGLLNSTQTLTQGQSLMGRNSPRNSVSTSSYLSRIDFPETENNALLINPFYNSYNNFSSCFSVDDISQSNNGHLTLRNGDQSTRPQSPDTEYDEEFNFPSPTENQPIMAAAYALNHEARLWSSKDNEIIASVRKMAQLMAKLSLIMRGEFGTKKELINVSIAIAEASLEVYKCSKKLASQCTDRRMITSLEQLGDRILMISNQLKIIATVKATMLGTIDTLFNDIPCRSEIDCGSVEDQQNTEVLVGNAQNLMQTVIETLHAAEGASLRLKGDKFKIKWHPRVKSYQHFLE